MTKRLKDETKSDWFVRLYKSGKTVGEISKLTESHYSFVYGVIESKVGIEKTTKDSKSNKFRELFDQGKTVGEIAKETNSNYSFVFSVIKKYKKSKKSE